SGGPLCVSDVPDHHPICEAFIESALALGFPRNDDFNGARQEGVGYHQTTTRNGRRCSTAVGYLRPAMARSNLQVVTEALTEKILFDGHRAIGIAFRRGGETWTARAAREIILCGGAVNSPQLLMLSGIGPEAHLAGLGIPVVQNLAGVGQSLQDHYSAPLKLKCQLRPDSRGQITLKSANPADPPAVYPNYLTAETDQRTIVAGLKMCRRILASPHMQPFLESEFLPGPEVQSDDDLLDFARRRGGT